MEFFNTRMGQKFFNGDVPRLIKAIERVADSLEADNRSSDVSTMLQMAEAGHPAPWAVYGVDDKLLDRACEDNDFYERFNSTLFEEIESDQDSYKDIHKLVCMYKNSSKEYRMMIDAVLVSLCGWSLPTLLKKAAGEEV